LTNAGPHTKCKEPERSLNSLGKPSVTMSFVHFTGFSQKQARSLPESSNSKARLKLREAARLLSELLQRTSGGRSVKHQHRRSPREDNNCGQLGDVGKQPTLLQPLCRNKVCLLERVGASVGSDLNSNTLNLLSRDLNSRALNQLSKDLSRVLNQLSRDLKWPLLHNRHLCRDKQHLNQLSKDISSHDLNELSRDLKWPLLHDRHLCNEQHLRQLPRGLPPSTSLSQTRGPRDEPQRLSRFE